MICRIDSAGAGCRRHHGNHCRAPLQQRKTESSDTRQQFLNVFSEIREEVLADPMLAQKDASEWMARMLDHNVPGGKLNRGMAVKETLMMIMPNASEELQKQADFVGWSIEFLQVQPLSHAHDPPRHL